MADEYNLLGESVRGDAEDLVELEQLLAGPHRILFRETSPYQEILLLQSETTRLYLNGQLQFSSLDEKIYHEALVHPAMMLTPRRERILLVSCNDGLALREVLKYADVRRVCLVDNDPQLLDLARLSPILNRLHEGSVHDTKVHIHDNDLGNFLKRTGPSYDVIIVDFLDPADEEISLKYRRKVFRCLSQRLAPNGILVCQGSSPKDAPLVFWSIARTLEEAGLYTLSYHVNVPTFGDWGFHLAAKKPLKWLGASVEVPNNTLPRDLGKWFELPPSVMASREAARANNKRSLVLHRYYRESLGGGTGLQVDPAAFVKGSRIQGDSEDLIELRQLVSGPHLTHYQGASKDYDILLIASTDVRMYLDKQLQFSSLDEAIYHEALVHPAMLLAASPKQVLVVGGGDGLAVREIAKYPDVERIDLVDLDPFVLQAASDVDALVSLNRRSLYDKRVHIYPQDAALFIRDTNRLYDVIIVDFPDPADDIISRLYTTEFFRRLSRCLKQEGVIVCQSHSPTDAPLVYWSIGLTLESAGFETASYHVCIPSFGDWGFHLAAKHPLNLAGKTVPVPLKTLPENLLALCNFSDAVLGFRNAAKVNHLENLVLHELYAKEVGVNQG